MRKAGELAACPRTGQNLLKVGVVIGHKFSRYHVSLGCSVAYLITFLSSGLLLYYQQAQKVGILPRPSTWMLEARLT